MIDMANAENREKVTALIALYNQTFAEVVRYRDMEWKITAWTVALLAGVIGATRFSKSPVTPCLRELLIVFSILVAAYGIWHVYYAHHQLTKQRQRRRECERILRFHDRGIYYQDAVLPVEWATTPVRSAPSIAHLIAWCGVIASVAAFTVYAVATRFAE